MATREIFSKGSRRAIIIVGVTVGWTCSICMALTSRSHISGKAAVLC